MPYASSYPLDWPPDWKRTLAVDRKRAPFVTTFEKARRELVNELRLMKAGDVVISTNLPLRQDGYPREDAARYRIADPGAAVYFRRGKHQLVIARDAYETVHGNIRSIGLAIEGMRQMERHGGSQMTERAFSGFAALPPPDVDWRMVLSHPSDLQEAKAMYKVLALKRHPDRGGSPGLMEELNRAMDAAKLHFGAAEV